MSFGIIEEESGTKVLKNLVDVGVVNNLTSTSTTDALSANQGKVLNEKISAVEQIVNDACIGQGSGYLAPGKTYILRDRDYNIIDSRFFKVILSANQSYGYEVFAYEYFGVIHYTPHEGTDHRGVTTTLVSNVGITPVPETFSVEFGYDEGGIYVVNNGIVTAYMTVIAKKEDILI